MIQPLQRNWRWFHKQREQCTYWAFLEFLLPCLYLHNLKVSQLEKESQEQRERCKMLSAELENAYNSHRTFIFFQIYIYQIINFWISFSFFTKSYICIYIYGIGPGPTGPPLPTLWYGSIGLKNFIIINKIYLLRF